MQDPVNFNNENQGVERYPGVDNTMASVIKRGTLLARLEGPEV